MVLVLWPLPRHPRHPRRPRRGDHQISSPYSCFYTGSTHKPEGKLTQPDGNVGKM